MPRFLLFCLFAAILTFLPCASLSSFAADPATPQKISGAPPALPADDDPLAQIWITRSGDLDTLVKESAELQKKAELLSTPLGNELKTIRSQFMRLSGLFQISRGHPTEQLTMVQQMHNLNERLQGGIAPIEEIVATINKRLEETAALQKEFIGIAEKSEHQENEDGEDKEMQEIRRYTKILADAQKNLNASAQYLKKNLTPAQKIKTWMSNSINEIESGLIKTWEEYYLTPSGTSLEALASTPVMLTEWAFSLTTRMSFAYPQSFDEWLHAAKQFASSGFIMILIGALVLRSARHLPGRWQYACEQVVKRPWVLVGIGLALTSASANQQGGIYFAFALFGTLIIVAGIAALSWRLRVAVLPELQWKPSPLMRMYPPAAMGVLMLFSDLPTRILGIVWVLTMVVFIIMIHSLNRKNTQAEELPFLERFSYGCAFWFGLGSMLVALAGYARLAILLFMFLFALVNIVMLANAMTALFSLLVDRFVDKEQKPVRNAIAQAISTPVSWIFSLVCALPWLWAVPGANYLVRHAMSTNYTVGEASFDFSRLLVIVILFFLFRSFASLLKTSLDHLPERMPNIERGVIPPLNTMTRYGLWTVFTMIALGMVGVNFTSLAVVAGGLSVGIGFGMQNIFNNLISGLMLIFGRTILVGDSVEIAGAAGTVREISIRSIAIETSDRAMIYMPNSLIMAGQLKNWTRNSRMVRRSIEVGVAYGTDTTQVAKLLLEMAGSQEHVLKFPAPEVFFSNFGDNSLAFTLNVFVDDISNALSVLSNLRFKIEKGFAENGIDIPFPQMTLHMTREQMEAKEGEAASDQVVLEKEEKKVS